MSTALRIRVTWSGTPVTGPGVSTFYFDNGSTGVPPALLTFFNAIKGLFPSGITWTVPSELDVINVETGELEGSEVQGGGGVIGSSGGSGDFKPGVGLRLVWNTGGITRGRRVHGTTFAVPLVSVEIPNGVPSASAASVLPAAGNALRTTATLTQVIYTKPKPPPGGIGPDSPGKLNDVTSVSLPPKLSWLRTRRT